jgi:branched-chain amino acid transport system permease protein
VVKTTQAIYRRGHCGVRDALFWFLNRTRTGKSMRAYSDNETWRLLSGINPDRVVMVTWIIAAAFWRRSPGRSTASTRASSRSPILQLLLPIFASAIVGGIGQPVGAIAGGFIVAFSEVMLTYAYKRFAAYLLAGRMGARRAAAVPGTDYKFAVSFVILVIVLLIRPTGIFRGKSL